jgi:hypothetical protein
MSLDLDLKVFGCEEIAAALLKLPPEWQDKYGARGLAASAEITVMAIRGQMRGMATGLARASIGATPVKFYRGVGTLFTAVGPRKGFRRNVSAPGGGLSRIQDPRRYFHFMETGRRAVSPSKKRALHSALDPQNRFFAHAKGVTGHPILKPARDSVVEAGRIAIENEINKGVAEWEAAHSSPIGESG